MSDIVWNKDPAGQPFGVGVETTDDLETLDIFDVKGPAFVLWEETPGGGWAVDEAIPVGVFNEDMITAIGEILCFR